MGSLPSGRHACRLLGEQRGEDIFCPLPTLEALVGIQDQRLNQRLRLLTTRFPTGFDGQAPLHRGRRKASQRPERIGQEHQTPMLSHGFSVAPAILVQAQRGLTVLRKRLYGPALPLQGDEPWRIPVHSLAHPHDIGARQLRALAADHQPDCAEPGETHGSRQGPGGFVLHGHGSVGRARNAWNEVCHRHVWSRQRAACARRLLADAAVRRQMPVFLQQAEPVFVPVAGHGPQLFRELPAVEHEDATRYFMWSGSFAHGQPQIDCRPNLLRELLPGCSCQHNGSHFCMESCPFRLGWWDGTVGEVLVGTGFPRRALFVAPRPSESHGTTHRPTDVRTRDRMVRERLGVLARVGMPIPIVEETAYLRAHGGIEDQERVRLRTAHRLRLLEQRREPPVIAPVLEPGRFREEAGQGGFVGALPYPAAAVGPTCVVQDNQACQGMLEMAKRAPIFKELPTDSRVGGHHGSRSHDGKLHQPCALAPRRVRERA